MQPGELFPLHLVQSRRTEDPGPKTLDDPALMADDGEPDREELRREVARQKRRLAESAARMESLEQVLRAIRAARGYRLLHALGRWKGVGPALDELLGDAAGSEPLAVPDAALILVTRGHNIPAVVAAGSRMVAAFRLKNTGRTTLWLPAQHTRFWDTSGAATTFALALEMDGRLLSFAQVPEDRIRPGGTATIFFLLDAKGDGQHQVRAVLTEVPRDSEAASERQVVFEAQYRAEQTPTPVPPGVKQRLFWIRCAEWPRLRARFGCWYARATLRFARSPEERLVKLRRLKDENARLAFIEKQMRSERVASLPSYLTIDTTIACNIRCPLCYREDPVAGAILPDTPHMSTEMMGEVFRTLLPTARTVSPSGWGEPLLSPHLDALIDACVADGVLLSLTTNGVLLNRKGLLDRLVPVLHWIELSIDSLHRETFERLRAGARFEQVMRNALEVGRRRMAQPRPRFSFGFSMTLFSDNLTELPAMLRLVADSGGNFLKTDIGVIFDAANMHHSVLRDPGAYNEAYAAAHADAAALGLKLFMRAPFADADTEAFRYGACDFLYSHAGISTDGSYKPCYSVILPKRRDAPDSTLASLWNSPEMQRLRRDHDTDRGAPSCRTCYMTQRGSDSVANRRAQFLRFPESAGSHAGA